MVNESFAPLHGPDCTIVWQAPVMFIGHVIQYSVSYTLQGVSSYIYVNASLMSCIITGLFPATSYSVQVSTLLNIHVIAN